LVIDNCEINQRLWTGYRCRGHRAGVFQRFPETGDQRRRGHSRTERVTDHQRANSRGSGVRARQEPEGR